MKLSTQKLRHVGYIWIPLGSKLANFSGKELRKKDELTSCSKCSTPSSANGNAVKTASP